MIHVLWFYVDKFGCGTYRVYIPAYSLEQSKHFTSSFIWSEDVAARKDYINDLKDNIDLVVLQRPCTSIYEMVIQDCKELGLPVVLEMDDLLFDVPRHNPAAWIWRKKPIQAMFKRFLESVDKVIVSTVPLAQAVQEHMEWSNQDKIAICHNHLHDVAWGPEVIKPDAKIYGNDDRTIIGWQGSTTHEIDFKECIPALKRVLEEGLGKVKLRLFGDVPKSLKDQIHWSNFEWTGGVPYELYPAKLQYCNFDIGLAPVTPSKFNEAKSNIKWMEYAAVKVPTVASRVYPYENSIYPGITGMLCSTEQEWYEALTTLIHNPELRRTIGEAAFSDAWQNWSAKAHAACWERAFESLVAKPVSGEHLSV